MRRHASAIRRLGLLDYVILASFAVAVRGRGTMPAARFGRVFRLWHRLLSRPPLAQMIAKRTSVLDLLHRRIGTPDADRRDLLARHVLGRALTKSTVRSPFAEQMDQWFALHWHEVSEFAGSPPEQPGIVVGVHQHTTQLIMKHSMKPGPELIIGKGGGKLVRAAGGTRTQQSVAMTRDLIEARKLLKAGRIVGILGDGYKGASGRVRKVGEFERLFQPGFAVLAVQNQVPVQFIESEWLASGRVKVTLSAPFSPPACLPTAEQIDACIDWYCERLEPVYRDRLHSITDNHLRLLLAHPIRE